MNEDELNELKLKMSIEVPNQPTVIKEQLAIDNDPSFDIYFDIFNGERKKYLYIKLVENSAVAPFYYNRSYTIEELRELDPIFMAVDINKAKGHLKRLFENNKVKLTYNEETGGIKMILEVRLFYDPYPITFELYKEMIPDNEKDEQLINLYNINKRKLKFAKKLLGLYEGKIDQNIIEELRNIFDIENNAANNNCAKTPFDEFKEILGKKKFGTIMKESNDAKDIIFKVEIKNKTEKKLTPDNIKFKLDKKSSNAFCKDITFLFYEKDKYQKGIITFYFDEDTEPGEHKCIFDVFIDGKQLKDYQYILNITIPEKE
jgi:hypothetical protein